MAVRKVTSILAADVAGYSRLMADNERATVDTLTDNREVFAQHVKANQSRIANTAGDSLLLEFPSAVEAVESASEIQQVLKGCKVVAQDMRTSTEKIRSAKWRGSEHTEPV